MYALERHECSAPDDRSSQGCIQPSSTLSREYRIYAALDCRVEFYTPVSPELSPQCAISSIRPKMSRREDLKRHHAAPSVCLRPSPSKRLARSRSISPWSGLPTTSHHTPMYYPQRSKKRVTDAGRPDAQQWFNESNHNVSSTAISTFPHGKSDYLCQSILRQPLMCV